MKGAMQMTIKIKGKTVLVLAAGAGMLITAWLAAKNTPEAQKRKEEALQAKREITGDENAELTFFESAKAQIGAYIPAIISGTVTIGSLVGSEIINKDTLKKAEKAVDEFKTRTDKLDGKGSSRIIEKAVEQKKLDEKTSKPWDVKERFRIRFQDKVIEFESSRADVIEALYCANRYFQGRGMLTFNQLLEFFNQEPVEEGDDRGWEAYIGEAIYGYTWIDFGLKECEYVVLEVGLGGRFDATNVIPAPAVTGIVSISLDHTAILGDTIEKIAAEKCGIIKSGSPVVSYPLQNSEALAVISETCRERNVPLIIPDISRLDIKDKSVHGTSVSYKGIDFLVPLAGEHMVFNAVTAVEIIKALDVTVRDEYISEGIGISVMPARMELISESPVTVLDGGHNEDCANALRGYIKSFLSDRRIIMVSSIMADKDYDSYLRIVGSCADVFIATKAGVPRALESSALCSDASKYCANCMEIGSPVEAVGKAMILAEKEDAVIVCGSFYLAGDVRDYLINGG